MCVLGLGGMEREKFLKGRARRPRSCLDCPRGTAKRRHSSRMNSGAKKSATRKSSQVCPPPSSDGEEISNWVFRSSLPSLPPVMKSRRTSQPARLMVLKILLREKYMFPFFLSFVWSVWLPDPAYGDDKCYGGGFSWRCYVPCRCFFEGLHSRGCYHVHQLSPRSQQSHICRREDPIVDSSGVMMISADGQLVVMDGRNGTLWSSGVLGSSTARLLDTGNLVLYGTNSSGGDGGNTIWESFLYPTDSMLPNSKLSSNARTNEKISLSSWSSLSDPSAGSFLLSVEALNIPEAVVWKGKDRFWRSGPWNGKMFVGEPPVTSVYHDGFIVTDDKEGDISFTYTNTYTTYSYHVLKPQGEVVQTYWDEKRNVWNIIWTSQLSDCDVYGRCGPFGVCDARMVPICRCLKGFRPKFADEWNRGNWTAGCERKSLLECNKTVIGSKIGDADGFFKLGNSKVPYFVGWFSSAPAEECPNQCLANCSCVAYAYDPGIGCMYWHGELIDLQTFYAGATDVYIRLAKGELGSKRNLVAIIIPTAATVGTVGIFILAFFISRRVKKRRAMEAGEENIRQKLSEVNLQELFLFKLEVLATATLDFSESNQLGHGGFGPVYKGKLPDGQEIAVKRLSAVSGQGLEEFINEMVVISKVQHRNLVRLLGCCIEGGEKMLVYEFMQNKSLDVFLFDPCKREQLDWMKRFNIIDGICRGLLYLHRDSRMTIIHRDLKASNILLDENLNPKISDFGMAKIFGGNEHQANTKRVVGTYGYMAPEYAMRGRFSEKSDVYSFGILLLEIVSGRRNTSFDEQDQQPLGLPAIAWRLWKEDEVLALVDPMLLSESSAVTEVLRCIHLGLLCTEQLPEDRPSISGAVSMLNSEIVDLPSPKQPAFYEEQINRSKNSFGRFSPMYSVNDISDAIVEGR